MLDPLTKSDGVLDSFHEEVDVRVEQEVDPAAVADGEDGFEKTRCCVVVRGGLDGQLDRGTTLQGLEEVQELCVEAGDEVRDAVNGGYVEAVGCFDLRELGHILP